MPIMRVLRSNDAANDVRFGDEGTGAPVVFVFCSRLDIHTWKLFARRFSEEGHRVLTVHASNLDIVFSSLDLQQVAIVAHAGGTQDVIRFFSRDTGRILRAVFISPVAAYTAEDPDDSSDVRAELRAITVPVLVVASIDDRFTHSPIARHPMTYSLASSKTILYPETAAGLLVAYADEIVTAILAFVDD